MKEHPILFSGSMVRAILDSINAKRAPWDSNPWVWAVTFRRIDTNPPAEPAEKGE